MWIWHVHVCIHYPVSRHEYDTYMYVYCSAGAGRTGTFIGLENLIEEAHRDMQSDQTTVDVFTCVSQFRDQRMQMVQTGVSSTDLYHSTRGSWGLRGGWKLPGDASWDRFCGVNGAYCVLAIGDGHCNLEDDFIVDYGWFRLCQTNNGNHRSAKFGVCSQEDKEALSKLTIIHFFEICPHDSPFTNHSS